MSVAVASRVFVNQRASRFDRAELDILRFLAFFLVFLDHAIARVPNRFLAAIKDGGAFGVSIFFALSAYLITELLFREKATVGAIDLRAFYIRRALRIWPLYFFALSIPFILSKFLVMDAPFGVRQFLPYVFFLGNVPPMKSQFLPFGFSILWSISLEEQFYLVWPTLVKRFKPGTLLFVCSSIWIISQGYSLSMKMQGVSSAREWFNPLVQMQYFAIGAALAILLRGNIPTIPTLFRALMIVAGVTSFFLFPRLATGAQVLPYLCAGIATLAILVGFLGMNISKKMKRLRYLGKISYGLYVFHYAMLSLVGWIIARKIHLFQHMSVSAIAFPLALCLTLAVAHLSYQYYEKPFLRMKEHFEVVRSREA